MKAFPVSYKWNDGMHDGMDLRDYFAAQAMQGMIGGMWPTCKTDRENIAEFSYQMADAMMKAREAA